MWGSLADLLEEWDAPVYANELEIPYLTNGTIYFEKYGKVSFSYKNLRRHAGCLI